MQRAGKETDYAKRIQSLYEDGKLDRSIKLIISDLEVMHDKAKRERRYEEAYEIERGLILIGKLIFKEIRLAPDSQKSDKKKE
jgi:hypothetical protein